LYSKKIYKSAKLKKIDDSHILYLQFIYQSMQPIIQYNQEFKDKLRNIYKNKLPDRIVLKCKYPEYYNIILDCTLLPTVLINLICVWLDDEIVLKIQPISGYFNVKLEDTYINFVKIHMDFKTCNNYFYDLYFSNNILLFDDVIDDFDKYRYTFLTYNAIKKSTDKTYVVESWTDGKFIIRIVNHNLLLTVRDLYNTIKNFINQPKN